MISAASSRDLEIEAVARHEAVHDVEVLDSAAVQLDHPAVLDDQARLRVGGPVHGHEAERRLRCDEHLPAKVACEARSAAPRAGHASRPRSLPTLRRLADERRNARGAVLPFEARRPRLELCGARPARPERRVDLEDDVVGNGGQLGRSLQALGELPASVRPGDFRLSAQRVGRRAHVGGVDGPATQRLERHVVQALAGGCPHEVRASPGQRIIGYRIEGGHPREFYGARLGCRQSAPGRTCRSTRSELPPTIFAASSSE